MLAEFREWIHRHLNILLSFAVGLTFGISILARILTDPKPLIVRKEEKEK